MSLRRPLAPVFPIERQLAVDATSVVLVNVFVLDKADEQTFLQAWQKDALFMKRQPGFIATQLHRAIGESQTYLNYAVWESTADSACIHTSGFPGETLGVSVLGGRFPALVPEGGSTGDLRRVAEASLQEGRASHVESYPSGGWRRRDPYDRDLLALDRCY